MLPRPDGSCAVTKHRCQRTCLPAALGVAVVLLPLLRLLGAVALLGVALLGPAAPVLRLLRLVPGALLLVRLLLLVGGGVEACSSTRGGSAQHVQRAVKWLLWAAGQCSAQSKWLLWVGGRVKACSSMQDSSAQHVQGVTTQLLSLQRPVPSCPPTDVESSLLCTAQPAAPPAPAQGTVRYAARQAAGVAQHL